MLSPKTIAVVQETVPVLQEHGETLTRHFYQRMFRDNPEVQAFFNPAHQHAGTQQRALAAAICAYAQHIENPVVLADAVELIAQKHASLGVQAEHYPIVGKHLLASIREVLGDAATDDILGAWAEAYGFLADLFITRESAIYDEHRARAGWAGFRRFTVAHRAEESAIITSFTLRPADGPPLGPFEPGQYLTVRVPGPDGTTTMRNYSLSAAPDPEQYRISVKREPAQDPAAPAGYVSHYLHDRVAVGDTLEVGPPCGVFTLDRSAPADRPLVLLAGGVGATPLLAMLHTALEEAPDRPVVFLHAVRDGASHAFGDELRALAQRHPRMTLHVRYSDATDADRAAARHDDEGFVDPPLLQRLVPGPDADCYLCGPHVFMAHCRGLLTQHGVAPDRIHHEHFGPARPLA